VHEDAAVLGEARVERQPEQPTLALRAGAVAEVEPPPRCTAAVEHRDRAALLEHEQAAGAVARRDDADGLHEAFGDQVEALGLARRHARQQQPQGEQRGETRGANGRRVGRWRLETHHVAQGMRSRRRRDVPGRRGPVRRGLPDRAAGDPPPPTLLLDRRRVPGVGAPRETRQQRTRVRRHRALLREGRQRHARRREAGRLSWVEPGERPGVAFGRGEPRRRVRARGLPLALGLEHDHRGRHGHVQRRHHAEHRDDDAGVGGLGGGQGHAISLVAEHHAGGHGVVDVAVVDGVGGEVGRVHAHPQRPDRPQGILERSVHDQFHPALGAGAGGAEGR
jgi:hypothetical protein